MSQTIEEQVRKAIRWALTDPETTLDEKLAAIMGHVAIYGVLARREGYAMSDQRAGRSRRAAYGCACHAFPLPERTRKVLREETDPECRDWKWRVREGAGPLEVRMESGAWGEVMDYRGAIPVPPTRERVALWADLLSNPYRTEEVEIDESDPWGDAVEARSE